MDIYYLYMFGLSNKLLWLSPSARAEPSDIFWGGAGLSHFPWASHSFAHYILNMTKYTSVFKHAVLQEYCAGNRAHSFRALARRFKVHGGPSTICKWYRNWKGTQQSLERRAGSGRRTLLTPAQVERYIVKPIRRCNKNHVAVEYHDLKDDVEEKVGHSVSVRTLRRYGKEKSQVHFQHTIRRTPVERTLRKYIPPRFYSLPRRTASCSRKI